MLYVLKVAKDNFSPHSVSRSYDCGRRCCKNKQIVFLIRVTNNNKKGQNLRLFNNLVDNGDVKADRNCARLPTWLNLQWLFLFPVRVCDRRQTNLYRDSKFYKELVWTKMVSLLSPLNRAFNIYLTICYSKKRVCYLFKFLKVMWYICLNHTYI